MRVEELRGLLDSKSPAPIDEEDYWIVSSLSGAYLALNRSGAAALLIPLLSAVDGVGRSGGGFSLSPAPDVVFNYRGSTWRQPAATLECTDGELTDTFLVLVLDLVSRLQEAHAEVSWPTLVSWLDDWQAFFAKGMSLSKEEEMGLWGELWVISRATNADLLLSAWRGPEDDPTDFFLAGIGVEVKVSRRLHVHYISQSQVARPLGDHDAYVLSMWVAQEPAQGVALSELVDEIMRHVADAPMFARRLAEVGYSLSEKTRYLTRYSLLENPTWFRAENIPQVRTFDAGITQLRYLATLDASVCCDSASSRRLWGVLTHAQGSDDIYAWKKDQL